MLNSTFYSFILVQLWALYKLYVIPLDNILNFLKIKKVSSTYSKY